MVHKALGQVNSQTIRNKRQVKSAAIEGVNDTYSSQSFKHAICSYILAYQLNKLGFSPTTDMNTDYGDLIVPGG
jgi:hypothetical protein